MGIFIFHLLRSDWIRAVQKCQGCHQYGDEYVKIGYGVASSVKFKHSDNFFKKSSSCFDVYSVISKQVCVCFQIFVGFSENLNFITI